MTKLFLHKNFLFELNFIFMRWKIILLKHLAFINYVDDSVCIYWEYLRITRIQMHTEYIFICWCILQSVWKMERNQSLWMHCLAVSGGRKRFFLAAGVFLPVTFVASTSSRLTFPILGHSVDEEERRALNAYRFPYRTHVTSFPSIYVLFHTHNGQSPIFILPAFNFFRSWFPGLIWVNEQKCRFRKWRKHSGFCVWTWLRTLTRADFYLSINGYIK